jgi:hypothetical protein
MSGPELERSAALGRRLVAVHDELRRELTVLRGEVGGPSRVPANPLLERCLALCAAVATHHGGEDAGVFPALARAYPELRGAIGQLADDHRLVAEVIRHLRSRGGELTGADLDGLAAILESHFGFEERRLAAVLDSGPDRVADPERAAIAAALRPPGPLGASGPRLSGEGAPSSP